MHYHRAGHGVTTSAQTQRGHIAFVHTKINHVIGANGIHVAGGTGVGASGIHADTLSLGDTEGDMSDNNIAYTLQDNEAGEIFARGKYLLSQLRPLGENSTFLVDGYVAGGTAILAQAKIIPRGKDILSLFRPLGENDVGEIIARGRYLGTVLGLVHASTLAFDEPESDMSDKSIAYTPQGNLRHTRAPPSPSVARSAPPCSGGRQGA